MLIMGWATAIVAGWFLCLAAPRHDSRLRGGSGFVASAVFFAISTAAFARAGLGLAEAIACALALLMLAVPCASWYCAYGASRKRRATV